MGRILRDQGRYAEAIVHHEAAIHLQPDLAYAYENLGYALADSDQHELAAAAYCQALLLDPENAEKTSKAEIAEIIENRVRLLGMGQSAFVATIGLNLFDLPCLINGDESETTVSRAMSSYIL